MVLLKGTKLIYPLLFFYFGILRCNICDNSILKTGYKVTKQTECLISYSTDSGISKRVPCAARCSQLAYCYQFLYCRATDYCWINGVDNAELLLGCNCYEEDSEFRCQNGGTLIAEKSCSCLTGYYGNRCEKIIRDCTEGQSLSLSDQREQESFIQPDGADQPFTVLCDFKYGFTFLLYRGPKSCGTMESFNRRWVEYVEGFGTLACEHWLGLEKFHLLTSQGSYNLEILVDDGLTYYQCYFAPFTVDGASTGYRANVPFEDTDPLCNAFLHGGSALDINGYSFSTFDNDSQGLGCPASLRGGWWYGQGCSTSNMNGPYIGKNQFTTNPNQIRLNVGGQFSNSWVKVLVLRIIRYGP